MVLYLGDNKMSGSSVYYCSETPYREIDFQQMIDKTIEVIDIPYNLTQIGEYTFYACPLLTTVNFANNTKLESIKDYAFADCSSLTNIVLPNTLKSIGNYSFRNCTALTSIIIPDSVETISSTAFSGCTNLTSIKIPTKKSGGISGSKWGATNATVTWKPNDYYQVKLNLFDSDSVNVYGGTYREYPDVSTVDFSVSVNSTSYTFPKKKHTYIIPTTFVEGTTVNISMTTGTVLQNGVNVYKLLSYTPTSFVLNSDMDVDILMGKGE